MWGRFLGVSSLQGLVITTRGKKLQKREPGSQRQTASGSPTGPGGQPCIFREERTGLEEPSEPGGVSQEGWRGVSRGQEETVGSVCQHTSKKPGISCRDTGLDGAGGRHPWGKGLPLPGCYSPKGLEGPVRSSEGTNRKVLSKNGPESPWEAANQPP